jgi:hypothetical protein
MKTTGSIILAACTAIGALMCTTPTAAAGKARWAILSATSEGARVSYVPDGSERDAQGHARSPFGTVIAVERDIDGFPVQREFITLEFDCAGKQRTVDRRFESSDGRTKTFPDSDWTSVGESDKAEEGAACGRFAAATFGPKGGLADMDAATYAYLSALRTDGKDFTPNHAAREMCHSRPTGENQVYSLITVPAMIRRDARDRLNVAAITLHAKYGASADSYGTPECEYVPNDAAATALREKWLGQDRDAARAAGKKHTVLDAAVKLYP